jgi:hypothetical protein
MHWPGRKSAILDLLVVLKRRKNKARDNVRALLMVSCVQARNMA